MGLYGALVLMGIFTLYVGYMLIFTSGHFCTCGGILEKLTWPEHLIFNVIFTILAIMAVLKPKNNQLPNSEIRRTQFIPSKK